MASKSIQFAFYIPTAVRDRMRHVTNRIGGGAAPFIRDAVLTRIELFEAKFREEALLKKQERQDKLSRHRLGDLRPKTLEPLVPFSARTAVEKLPPDDPLAKIYEEHGKRIAVVLVQPKVDLGEKRLCIEEALHAIKVEAPLTHPSDTEILAVLEKYVLEARRNLKEKEEEKGKRNASRSAAPESEVRIIDPDKVKTFGDITP